ncbi:MAG TPA: Cof-type HAD-IIB family hydrolase [Ktedonobacterales bacterium]|jgi:hypothetical protein|nr:Cof-type HAD-IIB family hydrolase [Ktedonobacterales bacterium]
MLGEQTAHQTRLIATDLDGTLLRDDRSLSARTRQTLAKVQAAGIALVQVTARPPRFVKLLAEEVGLRGAAICCNGALVYDITSGALVEHAPLASADACALVVALREAFPEVTFAIERGLAYGCEPAYLALGSLTEPQGDLLGEAIALCGQPVTKLIARHPQRAADELYPTALRLVGDRAVVTYSSPRFLEISASGIDKATTLARYCKRLGIASSEVVAFGDMPNDIPMLRWAGRGVAVANAHPEALAAADAITASNMADGVARYLDELLAAQR